LGRSIAAQLAAGLGDYFRGRAVAATAEFFLGNPSAIVAAGLYSAAAGIMYSLAGAATSGGRGGGRASVSGGAASVPSTGGAQPQREINIYLNGKGWPEWDVDFQKSAGHAIQIVKETHGENWNFNVNNRRGR
jgi:hypothetical protein